MHDYAEIFDGVPSQHDGKDAAMVAELASMGKSVAWPYEPLPEFDQELRYLVDGMDIQQRIGMLWLGRLSALGPALARGDTIPRVELRNVVGISWSSTEDQRPWLPTPGGEANQRLGRLVPEKRKDRAVLQVSASSVGVRQTAVDRRRMEECAQAALSAKHEVQKASQTLEKLAQSHAILLATRRW